MLFRCFECLVCRVSQQNKHICMELSFKQPYMEVEVQLYAVKYNIEQRTLFSYSYHYSCWRYHLVLYVC